MKPWYSKVMDCPFVSLDDCGNIKMKMELDEFNVKVEEGGGGIEEISC